MGSLMKIFEGQNKVWNLGKTVSGYISQSQSSDATEAKKEVVKRPASVFAMFFQSKQSELKQQNPNLSQTEIMKLASSVWKNESADIQQKHKAEFDRKMEMYKLNMKEIPKRPKPPFIQFFTEKNNYLRYQHPNIVERAKKASEMWKNLSLIEKKRYKTSYANKLSDYSANLSDEVNELIQERKEIQNSKREQRDIRRYGKSALKEKPKSPIFNPFSMFVQEKASEVPANNNVFKYLGEKWRNMSGPERKVYQEKVNKAVNDYELELEEWKKSNDRSVKK